eukprot:35669_1
MGDYGGDDDDDLTEDIDIDVAYGLGTKWHGMQFRIRAVVMMMMGHVEMEMDGIDDISSSTCRGIPLHSTPVSTVNSSILHPWGEKAKEDGAHGHGDGTSNDEGKEVDGDDDGDDYILKEEDGGHGDGKSTRTRTGISIER